MILKEKLLYFLLGFVIAITYAFTLKILTDYKIKKELIKNEKQKK